MQKRVKAAKIHRVVKSTIAAETMALYDAADYAFYLGKLLQEVTRCATPYPIVCYVDNRSLCENLTSTKSVTEKRLRIDIAALREMLEKKEISNVRWVPTEYQIADVLTKTGKSSQQLNNLMKNGRLGNFLSKVS